MGQIMPREVSPSIAICRRNFTAMQRGTGAASDRTSSAAQPDVPAVVILPLSSMRHFHQPVMRLVVVLGGVVTVVNAFDAQWELSTCYSFDWTARALLSRHYACECTVVLVVDNGTPLLSACLFLSDSASLAPTAAEASTKQKQPPQPSEDAELVDACRAWVDGQDFREFPLERLLRAKQLYVRNCQQAADPDLALFLAISLEDHGQVTSAAECFVAAFRHPDTRGLDDYEGMDDELRARFKQRLPEVLELTDEEAVKQVGQVVSLRVQSAEEARTCFDARPKPPGRLTCAAGASYFRELCQHDEQVQLALYYADGLCVEHFGQCLFDARRKVSDSRRAVLYEDVSGEGRDPACVGHAQLSADHIRLLEAARSVANTLTPEAIEDVMKAELACATRRAGAEVDEWSMKMYFNPHDTVPYATPTFKQVQEMYKQLQSR